MKTAYAYPTYLECPRCKKKSDEADVTVILEHDGVVTYICPECQKIVESHRNE